jgi:LysR family nitrogen assimilation transcriptional regulator
VEIAQLQMVKLILETGSFYKAATRMNCAQSVVSRQLAALEHECGDRFFHRNARGVRLTDFGERMLPHIDVILAAAGEIKSAARRPREVKVQEVKIALGPQITPFLSGPLYNVLKGAHPNIRLSISEAVRENVRSDLKSGKIDVAVVMRSGRGLSSDDRVICPVATCLIGLPDSPATANRTIDFAELAGLPLLLPSQPGEWRDSLEAAAARTKITLSVVAEVNNSNTRAALVHEGAGYLIAPLLPGPASPPLGWIAAGIHEHRLRASCIVNPSIPTNLVVSVSDKPEAAAQTVAKLAEDLLHEMVKAPNGDDTQREDHI